MTERPPISPRSPRAALEPEQVPPPPKRSERARNPFVVVGNAIITILIILMIGAGAAYYYGRQMLEAPGPLKEDKVVNIPARAGKRDIADVLQREGVINVNPLGVYRRRTCTEGEFGLEARRIFCFRRAPACAMSSAPSSKARWCSTPLPIPEGLTSEQIVSRLGDNDIFTGSVREIPREGTLLPETYKFPRGTTRDQVIQRMQQAQKRVLAEIWERRNPDIPVRSPEQLVTLASIVEKETGKPDERSRVAAVFVNRLRQKMKLQSDPTIIYGLVGGKGTLGRPIKRCEISAAVALQHLRDRGPAAGTDRQSRPRLAGGRRQSRAHPRPVLRRRRHRRSRLHRDLRSAPEERRQAAYDRKADPERYRGACG